MCTMYFVNISNYRLGMYLYSFILFFATICCLSFKCVVSFISQFFCQYWSLTVCIAREYAMEYKIWISVFLLFICIEIMCQAVNSNSAEVCFFFPTLYETAHLSRSSTSKHEKKPLPNEKKETNMRIFFLLKFIEWNGIISFSIVHLFGYVECSSFSVGYVHLSFILR